ncbi:MAG: acyl transferase [Bacteroidia bacterium]|nr:acyl transferase [Bacteroidia bacterium]
MDFDQMALTLFRYQYQNNNVYRQYCNYLQVTDSLVSRVQDIPFLPIHFFKTHQVQTGKFTPEAVFLSSSTGNQGQSKHAVKNLALYEQSFIKAFTQAYGSPSNYVFLCLLPAYLERQGSSLVYMAQHLIAQSHNPASGFYLHNLAELHHTLQQLEQQNQQVMLLGVTFALLDFAEQFPMPLKHTLVMETGGMKGVRKEMIREEVHATLIQQLGVPAVHSEYGMTELLSQAYAKKDGLYQAPRWMHVYITDAHDLGTQLPVGKTGVVNIIDLANIHSCAFIQTQDIGKKHPDGSFEILGRLDQSDLRGCSLLYL